jgi:mannose-6-phosphate isomerase-like protein (cupin superfamily)
MQMTGLIVALLLSLSSPQDQQRPASPARPAGPRSGGPARSGGAATLAVRVTDPAGTPISDVKVTVDGPAQRQSTTEGGRIAFETLPSGTYRLRFEHEGFVTLEREVVARGTVPIDVKVTLTPAPAPPPPPPVPQPPAAPPAPDVNAAPLVMDLPAFIAKNYVGRGSQKTSPLACNATSTAALIQLHDPIEEHTHADFDEYLYVIAGQGTARIKTEDQPLTAGVFVMVPRGVSHALAASGKNPLVLLSVRPGDRCQPAAAAR